MKDASGYALMQNNFFNISGLIFRLTIVFIAYTLLRMKKEKFIMHGKFQSIMALTQKLEKVPKKFGTGQLLSHSEIHLIEIIGDNEDLSVTDIAKALGITKGAVSQSLKRLENKGLSFKETDPKNLSRSIVMLTAKGFTAFWAHRHWHETMDGGFLKYMEELNKGEIGIIINFMEKVEDFLKRRIQFSD